MERVFRARAQSFARWPPRASRSSSVDWSDSDDECEGGFFEGYSLMGHEDTAAGGVGCDITLCDSPLEARVEDFRAACPPHFSEAVSGLE